MAAVRRPCRMLLPLVFAGLAIAFAGGRAAPAAQFPPKEYPPAQSAVFLQRVLVQIVRNDFAAAWESLHPVQQESVPRDAYVRCELSAPIAARLAWIRVQRVVAREIVVPGAARTPVPAQAVVFRLKLLQGTSSILVTQTAHTVPVNGRWTWMLPASRFQLHRSGTCLRGE